MEPAQIHLPGALKELTHKLLLVYQCVTQANQS